MLGNLSKMKSDPVKPFRVCQKQLLAFLEQTRSLATSINCQTASLVQLIDQLKQSAFKVLVVGEFSRGKSTLINALLGEEILPSAAKPCTAIISEIKYGRRKIATIYFKDNVGKLPKGLSKDVVDHITQHKAKGSIPPLKVSVERLKDYVALSNAEAIGEQQNPDEVSPFSHAEIHVPLNLCKNGVEIIDSPGLNEQQGRADIATQYIDKADAIIFVLSCTKLASTTEMKAIEDLEQRGNHNIIFVCNCFDQVEEEEQEDIKVHARRKLLKHTDLKERGLYFVSAKQALTARNFRWYSTKRNAVKAQSGFQELEVGLRTFLSNDSGRVKLNKPGVLLLEYLEKKLPAVISEEDQRSAHDLETAKAAYQNLCADLEDLQSAATKDIAILRNKILQTKQHFREALSKIYEYIGNSLEGWVHGSTPRTTFGLLWTSQDDVHCIARQLYNDTIDRAQSLLDYWTKETLPRIVTEELSAFQTEAQTLVTDILERVTSIGNTRFGRSKDSPMGGVIGVDGELMNLILSPEALAITVRRAFFAGFTLGHIDTSGLIGLPRLFLDRMSKLKGRVGNDLVSSFRGRQLKVIDEVIANGPFFNSLEQRIDQTSKMIEEQVNNIRKCVTQAAQSCQMKEQEYARHKAQLDTVLRQVKALSCDVQAFLQEVNCAHSIPSTEHHVASDFVKGVVRLMSRVCAFCASLYSRVRGKFKTLRGTHKGSNGS